MENIIIESTISNPGDELYNYLFKEENFILGNRRLFKTITHAAQYGLRIKGVTMDHARYYKFLRTEREYIVRGVLCSFLTKKSIIAFRKYLWRIVQMRSIDICPHKEVCATCPLSTSCRRGFEDKFNTIYPPSMILKTAFT